MEKSELPEVHIDVGTRAVAEKLMKQTGEFELERFLSDLIHAEYAELERNRRR